MLLFFVVRFFLVPIPEILFLAAFDAASINIGASALAPDFTKLDITPFPFFALGFLGFLVFLTPNPIDLATVPIVGFIIPKTSPNKPFPFFYGLPLRLFLAPSPVNSGISLILLCKDVDTFFNPLCPALLMALITGLIISLC